MNQGKSMAAELVQTRIRAGIWEGLLTAADAPALEAVHQDVPLPGLSWTAAPGRPGAWAVRLPIPTSILSEGVQTILIRDQASGETLAHVTLITGAPVEEDLRAELDLLKAELDMLKRAFRRHCLETTG